MLGLEARTVLLTGAASGIGQALAHGFFDDDARVVAVDRNPPGLQSLAGRGALTLEVDVSRPDEVAGMVSFAVSETGRLDVLINNAGLGFAVELLDHAPDQFEELIRVNLFGPVYGMESALPRMREQGYGRIINVLSRAAEAGRPGFAAYGSSKAALWAVTRSVARENRDYDIKVNGLIPGPTKTAMNPRGEQDPSAVYPTARMLATLPADGPSGRVFWGEKPYRLFDPANVPDI